MSRANQIKRDYENVSDISIDLQVVTGVHHVSLYYRNVQNVVVKLHGESDIAVMVNCHFDSEAGSYGAGDDGVNCCSMLEILRVMAKSGRKNAFSTIFLFNGNEEGNLEGIQASHGFITQHKWAKDIKAFVNLEAQGAGGREFLFRSGPMHDWLIKKYRQSVKKPFGQVLIEEMFDSNVFKSGTDFESFRDAGNIPGLDLTYCNRGWIYHTKFDHIRYWKLEPIQNTGNNVLELMKLLANSEEVANPPKGTSAVYFDLWSFAFISYSSFIGSVINITVSVLAVAIPFLVQTEMQLENCKTVVREALIAFAAFTIGMILSLAACFSMGLLMNKADNTMFWFNTTTLSFGVYSSLAVLVLLAVQHVSTVISKCFSSKTSKFVDKGNEERRRVHAQLIGINLFWAMLTIVLTCFGLRFVYITMVVLLISLATNLLTYLLHMILPGTGTRKYTYDIN